MNTKRFIIAVLLIWILTTALRLILNIGILDWEAATGTEGTGLVYEDNYILNLFGILIFAFIFCFVFTRGYESKGVLEGVRYGFYIGLLISLPHLFDFYGIFNWPASITWGYPVGTLIITVLSGVVVSLVCQPKAI